MIVETATKGTTINAMTIHGYHAGRIRMAQDPRARQTMTATTPAREAGMAIRP
jgi:hypothetical protein